MTYATTQDLIDRFTQAELDQVADADNDGAADAEPVARALADADAEIDAALVGRYALPLLTPVPELLVRIACDLARESLHADRPTEVIQDRAKVARALLADLAAGRRRLDVAAAPAAESSEGLTEIVTGRRSSPFGV